MQKFFFPLPTWPHNFTGTGTSIAPGFEMPAVTILLTEVNDPCRSFFSPSNMASQFHWQGHLNSPRLFCTIFLKCLL